MPKKCKQAKVQIGRKLLQQDIPVDATPQAIRIKKH
jgi:hypothetical protein